MKKIILLTLAVVMLSGIVGCTQPVAGNILQSDKPRITSPEVNKTDLATLVEGNSEFAFDLY